MKNLYFSNIVFPKVQKSGLSDLPVDGLFDICADCKDIYFKDIKLGYVPSAKNILLSNLLYYGHSAIFESRIQFVNKESHPERQFRVVVKIKDNRQ